ncbi:MAG: hypothetical protein H0W25_01880, partial [Acidimicrobiia bacterium]|nr:hypothetical protein [Acidimicrobiia bacterium]
MNGTLVASLGELTDTVVGLLRTELPDERIVPIADADGVSDGEILVTLRSTEDEIRRALATGVRWVHVFGAGVDGVPLDLLGDVVVTCSRGASSVAISEFVLASMLAFEKQLPDVWLDEAPAQWGTVSLGQLAGRTLGLVGLGAIGIEVAKRALAFEMRVVGLRRRPGPA